MAPRHLQKLINCDLNGITIAMHANRILLGLAALLVVAPGARARVGETEPELVQRYGRVHWRSRETVMEQQRTYVVGESLQFLADDWSIYALIVNGHCERITYNKAGEWTEAQFTHLFEINGPLQAWKEEVNRNPKLFRTWTRKDGITASWQFASGLTITTPVYEQTKAAIKAAAKTEASKLPPF
jgi:hypothetical protein